MAAWFKEFRNEHGFTSYQDNETPVTVDIALLAVTYFCVLLSVATLIATLGIRGREVSQFTPLHLFCMFIMLFVSLYYEGTLLYTRAVIVYVYYVICIVIWGNVILHPSNYCVCLLCYLYRYMRERYCTPFQLLCMFIMLFVSLYEGTLLYTRALILYVYYVICIVIWGNVILHPCTYFVCLLCYLYRYMRELYCTPVHLFCMFIMLFVSLYEETLFYTRAIIVYVYYVICIVIWGKVLLLKVFINQPIHWVNNR